jgi:hypothetical protein
MKLDMCVSELAIMAADKAEILDSLKGEHAGLSA